MKRRRTSWRTSEELAVQLASTLGMVNGIMAEIKFPVIARLWNCFGNYLR